MILRYLRWLYYTLTGQEAVRLRLYARPCPYWVASVDHRGWVNIIAIRSEEITMANIGDRFKASIAPVNAAGNPAPVTLVWFEELTDQYEIVEFGPDFVIFEAVKPGSGAVVTVTAQTKSGQTLAETKSLPDVEAPPVDEEAVALNLSVVPA